MADLVNAILCLALLMALVYGYRWLASDNKVRKMVFYF